MSCGGHHAADFDGVAIGADEPSPGALAHALPTALPHQLCHALLFSLLPTRGACSAGTAATATAGAAALGNEISSHFSFPNVVLFVSLDHLCFRRRGCRGFWRSWNDQRRQAI